MWWKVMIPMYKLWLHGLYRLYRPWCPMSSKRLLNLITHSLTTIIGFSIMETNSYSVAYLCLIMCSNFGADFIFAPSQWGTLLKLTPSLIGWAQARISPEFYPTYLSYYLGYCVRIYFRSNLTKCHLLICLIYDQLCWNSMALNLIIS